MANDACMSVFKKIIDSAFSLKLIPNFKRASLHLFNYHKECTLNKSRLTYAVNFCASVPLTCWRSASITCQRKALSTQINMKKQCYRLSLDHHYKRIS